MTNVLRFFRLLSAVVWIGGIVFFAFILAPVAFHTLPTVHEAGLIVGACLRVFDLVALSSGVLLLIATTLLYTSAKYGKRKLALQGAVIALMTLATLYLHFGILPSMESDRAAAAGDITSVAYGDPHRQHFDKLHALSEKVEGGVLFAGIALLIMMSVKPASERTTES